MSRRGWIQVILLLFAVAGVLAGAWWTIEEAVLVQSLKEARTVADMAEDVGVWASQYAGGIHVQTQGADARIPGAFLTRSVYVHQSKEPDAFVSGSKLIDHQAEKAQLGSIEAYHWKNPALIQREQADVARQSLTLRAIAAWALSLAALALAWWSYQRRC